MIKNNKGFGIIQSILLCAFLVFLVIPAFSVITEKVCLKHTVHRITELADAAVMSSVTGVDTGIFSEGSLSFINEKDIGNRIYSLIVMNRLDGMEILEFDTKVCKAGDVCPSGCTSEYDFIHLLMKISLERRSSRAPVEFYVHRDVEFPYDR